ncbi:hypothetical protein GCM10010191_54820 [Actinomadura vinacea]|uniref:Knr4/Smi1-like domain-containing protein n=1 Tax=Actinomadura vinacea TaxID=115336 RepID=A0ABN3JNV7_9ACTN
MTAKPILYICDDEASPPDRGDEQDAPASAVPAGDPEEAVRLFHELMRRRAEIFGHEERLPPPASGEELDALEEGIGFVLPADLRALYRVANGDGTLTTALFDHHPWIPVEEVGDEDDEWAKIAREWQYDPQRTPVLDAVPANAVRRSILRPGWIRFAHDTGGNWLAVDMDPAPDGRPGQVIGIGVDYGEAPLYIADSVTAFLRRLVEALERGDYTSDEDDLHIEAGLPDWYEAEDARSLNTDARSLAGSASRPHLQKVGLTGVEDLGFLEALPNLRVAAFSGPGHLDLTPLRALPVEALELELESVDLAPLAGHAHVRSLTVRSKAPVDLAPLRTLPRLWALDVSAAPAADIATIAELPGLRYLEVCHDQWRKLCDDLPALSVVGIRPPEQEWRAGWTTVHGPPPSPRPGR